MICEMTQRIATEFDEFNDAIKQYDWYLYRNEIQRMFLILIVFMQQETVFKCFGNFSCSRVAFKQVSQIFNGNFNRINSNSLKYNSSSVGCKQRIFIFHGAPPILSLNSKSSRAVRCFLAEFIRAFQHSLEVNLDGYFCLEIESPE